MVRHGALHVKPFLGHFRTMSSEPLFFRLRLPEELKARIETAALANNRSMNAEVLDRLERSFGNDAKMPSLDGRLTSLESQVNELDAAYDKRLEKVEAQMWRLLEHAGLYDPNPD